ncbi:unnamed protein product [marine sediment metagenome]|uniref:Uncharacterized protein n=1 Tax=marine sediment metagenome TaxID=412755 RepID=X1L4H0_9ZZZZ
MLNIKTVTEQKTALQEACREFLDGWGNFINCIDFGHSVLNAEALRWMNEVPGQIQTAYTKSKKE